MSRPGAGMIPWQDALAPCLACKRPTMHPKGTPNARHPACHGVAVLPTAVGRPRNPAKDERGMNKTESAWAAKLEMERIAGHIKRWDFDCEALKLAKRTWYHPDFRVVEMDGRIRFDEVKGFMRDDAAVKLKVAAAMHPYRFFIVKKKGKAGWDVKEVRP